MVSVEANVAILDALHASLSGDVGRWVLAARRALLLHPEGAEPGRAIANINLGHALYTAGDPSEALTAFAEAADTLSREDRSMALIAALGGLALTQIDTGDLKRGESSTARAEQLVEELALGEDARVALSLLARGKLSSFATIRLPPRPRASVPQSSRGARVAGYSLRMLSFLGRG